MSLDLGGRRRFHVTNVGGAGMSAIAVLLAEMGHDVSGHDPAADTPFLARLRALGVSVSTGPARGPLRVPLDALITSTATHEDDPHVREARAMGVPVLHRSVALAALCRRRLCVAVAGTHGKTTTSALLATVLATVLTDAESRPGWMVGSAVPGLGTAAAWGGEGPLVVEADESDGSFLSLAAQAGVVTNLEPDHLEHWGDHVALVGAFERFVAGLAGPVVLCADDPGASALRAHAGRAVTYGTSQGVDYRYDSVAPEGTGARFRLRHDHVAHDVYLPMAPGAHNAANATAALAMAHHLGVDLSQAVAALAGFGGVARRFERRAQAAGVTFVDDYAHLPTETRAAIAAAVPLARAGGGRVVCAFQPHRYSRTESLWESFADAFEGADLLVLTDVYPAGEAPRPGISGRLVLKAVLDAHPRAATAYLPSLDDVAAYLTARLRPGDVCLTLGAGDLTTIPDQVAARLGEREARA